MVRPTKNKAAIFLITVWLLGILVMGMLGITVLLKGRFGLLVFGFSLTVLIGMLLCGTYMLLWNLVFSEKISITPETVEIQRAVPGFGRNRRFPTSGIKHFRIAKGWPYEGVDISYEFLGVGMWNVELGFDVEACSLLERINRITGAGFLLKRINRAQANEIARLLRARGFDVTGETVVVEE